MKVEANRKHKRRLPTTMAKRDEIIALVRTGQTREAVAKQLGIGVASVYRALKVGPTFSTARDRSAG